MSISSGDHRKFPSDETEATSVGNAAIPFFFPENPHQMNIREAPGLHWTHDTDDLSLPAPILTRPINSNHPLVPKWPVVGSDIIVYFKNESISWVGIELFSRCQDELQKVPTVLVTIEDLTALSLDQLQKMGRYIHRISGEFGFYISYS